MKRAAAALAVLAVGAGAFWTLRHRAPAPAPPPPAAPRPSVLLVTIDTLRADHVGAYGAKSGATPRLDALAARGLLFEEALSSVPLTLPSHATLLTGREPPHHGVRDNGAYALPAERETLATRLKEAGYQTGAFVGAYVLDRRFGLARGFDVYDDAVERRRDAGSTLESERSCAEVVARARAFLQGAHAPWLTWAHFYEPHAPYAAPAELAARFPGQAYEAEVAAADACLGELLEAAQAAAASGLLVAVASDHGEGLGEHGERTHGWFAYQATLRVPLVLAGAGLPSAERRPGPARLVDVTPTLLARLGLPPLAGADGRDLLAGPLPREAYAETQYPRTLGFAPVHAYRLGSLKLLDGPRPELYDLDRDPAETQDLAGALKADVERLRGALQKMLAAQEDARGAVPPEVAERLRALGYIGDDVIARQTERAPDAKDGLAAWHAVEDAVAAEARGAREEAVRLLRAAAAKHPANASLRRLLAGVLRRAGRAAEAASLLDGGTDDAASWHERALALAAAGRAAEALAAEDQALALEPALAEAHNHRGVLLAGQGRAQDALAAFDTALALDPNDARAWNNRANALRDLGRAEEARQAYERAITLAPRDPDPQNGLGVLAVQRGDLAAAEAAFRGLLARAPAYHDARLNLAVVLLKAGRAPDARAELDRLLAARPPEPLASRARGLRAGL